MHVQVTWGAGLCDATRNVVFPILLLDPDMGAGFRVHEIPFQFNLMKLLPRCQQVEMFFLMLTKGKYRFTAWLWAPRCVCLSPWEAAGGAAVPLLFFLALQPEGCADTWLSWDGIFVELLLEASKLGSCSVWQFLVLLPGHQNSYSSMAGQGRAALEAGTASLCPPRQPCRGAGGNLWLCASVTWQGAASWEPGLVVAVEMLSLKLPWFCFGAENEEVTKDSSFVPNEMLLNLFHGCLQHDLSDREIPMADADHVAFMEQVLQRDRDGHQPPFTLPVIRGKGQEHGSRDAGGWGVSGALLSSLFLSWCSSGWFLCSIPEETLKASGAGEQQDASASYHLVGSNGTRDMTGSTSTLQVLLCCCPSPESSLGQGSSC